VFDRPEDVVEYLSAKLVTEATALGIGYVGKYDERKTPRYPAVVVSAGPIDKSIHGSRTFNIEIRSFIWVYHAKATLTHAERSLADLALATSIVESLEADITMGGNVIHSYIETETPGVLQPRSQKSDLVIGTRLAHWALSQKRF
jgi:hypothetical protein